MANPAFHISSLLRPSAFAFAAVFAGLVVITGALRNDDAARYIERRYADIGKVLAAAIDPRFQSKADEITRVAERLVAIGAIKGGVLYDGSGHDQQSFGERIEASFNSVMRTGRTVFRTGSSPRADFYYPPEASGTPFHIFLRAEVGEITGLETIRDERVLSISLGGASIAAVITELLMLSMVWWPLRRVRTVIEALQADPSGADRAPPLRGWGGEVGKVTFAVECLRSMLADFWRTRVMVAEAILESSPYAVLQFNADGQPFFANPSCAKLFERDLIRTYENSPLMLRDMTSGNRHGLKAQAEFYRNEVRPVEFPTPKGPKQALMASMLLGAETRAPVNVMVAVDISPIHGARLAAEADLRAGRIEVARSTVRNFEYRLMLEACLVLMGGGKKREEHLQIASIGKEWLDAAVAAGLLQQGDLGEEDPQVAGGADDLRAVMRLAAMVVYAEVGKTPVDMKIEMRGIDFETAGLMIQGRAASGAQAASGVAEASLASGALRAAVARVGGQLSDVEKDEGGNVMLRVILRGAAERMHTAMKAKA